MEAHFACLLLLACLAAVATSSPVAHQQRLDGSLQEHHGPKQSCHNLCESCGCRGYYCGDECICQCNWADDRNVRCIQQMRSRSQNEKYPFEVLVQGPAGRRFVREATDIDPEAMAAYEENERSGRSVYSIYKPKKSGKGDLLAVADDAAAADQGASSGLLRAKLKELFKRPADPSVAAPAPSDPTVGAPAPAAAPPAPPATTPAPPPPPPPPPAADPNVGAPVPPPATAPAAVPDPGPVGSPATEAIVGNIRNLFGPSIGTSWVNLPALPTVTPRIWTTPDWLQRLSNPQGAIIVQPLRTL